MHASVASLNKQQISTSCADPLAGCPAQTRTDPPLLLAAHRHGLGWPHAQLSHSLSVLPQLQRQSPLLQQAIGAARRQARAAAAAAAASAQPPLSGWRARTGTCCLTCTFVLGQGCCSEPAGPSQLHHGLLRSPCDDGDLLAAGSAAHQRHGDPAGRAGGREGWGGLLVAGRLRAAPPTRPAGAVNRAATAQCCTAGAGGRSALQRDCWRSAAGRSACAAAGARGPPAAGVPRTCLRPDRLDEGWGWNGSLQRGSTARGARLRSRQAQLRSGHPQAAQCPPPGLAFAHAGWG